MVPNNSHFSHISWTQKNKRLDCMICMNVANGVDRDTADYPSDTSNIDPISPPASMDRLYDSNKTRVLRGGSYSSSVDMCSQSRRDQYGSFPGIGENDVGFRLALVYFDTEEDIPVHSIQIQYSDITRKRSPRKEKVSSGEKSN